MRRRHQEQDVTREEVLVIAKKLGWSDQQFELVEQAMKDAYLGGRTDEREECAQDAQALIDCGMELLIPEQLRARETTFKEKK